MAGRDRVRKTDPLKKPEGKPMTLADLTNQMTSEQREGKVPEPVTDVALVVAEDGSLTVDGYTLISRGLVVSRDPTEHDWETVGAALFRLDGAVQLLLGDWLVQAETRWGHTYDQIAEQTGYDPKTLRNYKYVAGAVDLSCWNRHQKKVGR